MCLGNNWKDARYWLQASAHSAWLECCRGSQSRKRGTSVRHQDLQILSMKAHTRSTWTSRQAVVLQGRGQAPCTFLHPGTVADRSRSKVVAAAECSLWQAALLQEGMRAATGAHGHTRHAFADRQFPADTRIDQAAFRDLTLVTA